MNTEYVEFEINVPIKVKVFPKKDDITTTTFGTKFSNEESHVHFNGRGDVTIYLNDCGISKNWNNIRIFVESGNDNDLLPENGMKIVYEQLSKHSEEISQLVDNFKNELQIEKQIKDKNDLLNDIEGLKDEL